MGLFDQALKILSAQDPEGFVSFGLRKKRVRVIRPVEAALPAHGREIDGGYLVELDDAKLVVHLEFHRRHQKLLELAIDVAEAQVRLFRREGHPVLSLVWDLYGQRGDPVREQKELVFGAVTENRSRVVYVRVNLRALKAVDLLRKAPPVLWPLVPLTRNGAEASAIRAARDAIEKRPGLSSAVLADHLAVLWLLADAEQVPVKVLQDILSKEKLMESELFQEAFDRGSVRSRIETIIRILTFRLGAVDQALRELVRTQDDPEILDAWYTESLMVTTPDEARRLIDKIRQAL
jgi:hypothetical protein